MKYNDDEDDDDDNDIDAANEAKIKNALTRPRLRSSHVLAPTTEKSWRTLTRTSLYDKRAILAQGLAA